MSKKFWDESFSDEQYVYGVKENAFIHKMSPLIPAHAKVGCFVEGEGRNAVYLAKKGHTVTAYDQSTVGLEKTTALAAKNNVTVETVESDLTKDELEKNMYDAAVMVFGHVPKEQQEFFITNIIQSVKNGGYVFFEVYSKKQLQYKTDGPQAVEMLYDPEQILQ